MILKSEQILALLRQEDPTAKADPLVIVPAPEEEELAKKGAASVDLRLGTWFVSLRQSRMSCLDMSGRRSEKSERQERPHSHPHLSKTHYVPFGGAYYLHPGNFVLGTTLEWLRLPINLFGQVIGKSSLGRRGLVIATAIGVHPGFTGCLTLELSNVGEIPLAIIPGMLVCQLCLHQVDQLGQSDFVDCSQFVGSHKPRLGLYQLDEQAQALADEGGRPVGRSDGRY